MKRASIFCGIMIKDLLFHQSYRRTRECKTEKVFRELKVENFSILAKHINLLIPEDERTVNRLSPKTSASRHITIKFPETKGKGKIFCKQPEKNDASTIKRKLI